MALNGRRKHLATVISYFTIIVHFGNFDPRLAATNVTAQPEGTRKLKLISLPCLCQEFRCDNGTFCLHKSKVCSGFPDCPNGEDEDKKRCDDARRQGGSTTTSLCGNGDFRCKFGGCIKLNQVCDLTVDCWGGVDEASDFCTWINT